MESIPEYITTADSTNFQRILVLFHLSDRRSVSFILDMYRIHHRSSLIHVTFDPKTPRKMHECGLI